MKDYSNAYAEAYTILGYLDEDELNKIPEDVLNAIKDNRNKEYVYVLNEDLDLQSQEMLPETKALLFNLFRDYLSTPEQKEKIIKMQKEERLKNEEKKKEQYSSEMFSNIESNNKVANNEENRIVEYKENCIIRFINYIKKFKNI